MYTAWIPTQQRILQILIWSHFTLNRKCSVRFEMAQRRFTTSTRCMRYFSFVPRQTIRLIFVVCMKWAFTPRQTIRFEWILNGTLHEINTFGVIYMIGHWICNTILGCFGGMWLGRITGYGGRLWHRHQLVPYNIMGKFRIETGFVRQRVDKFTRRTWWFFRLRTMYGRTKMIVV